MASDHQEKCENIIHCFGDDIFHAQTISLIISDSFNDNFFQDLYSGIVKFFLFIDEKTEDHYNESLESFQNAIFLLYDDALQKLIKKTEP